MYRKDAPRHIARDVRKRLSEMRQKIAWAELRMALIATRGAHISLVNHDPNAFEGIRHYGPALIVDALDAILSQVTGLGGSIVNGGSERERSNAVHAWRVYAEDLKCNPCR